MSMSNHSIRVPNPALARLLAVTAKAWGLPELRSAHLGLGPHGANSQFQPAFKWQWAIASTHKGNMLFCI